MIAISLSEISAPNTWLLLNPIYVKILSFFCVFFGSVLIFVFFFLIKKLHYNDFSAPEGLYSSGGEGDKDYWF